MHDLYNHYIVAQLAKARQTELMADVKAKHARLALIGRLGTITHPRPKRPPHAKR